MTNEELESVMNFMTGRLDERDRRQTELIEAHHARLERHDDGFEFLRGSLEQLSLTVDRYIKARDNGSHGQGA